MNIDNKMIMDLAAQMGLPPEQNTDAMKNAARQAGAYKNKSDDELVREILALKESLKSDKAAYEKQMATIKAFGSVMKGEQKARLMKIIELLES